MTVKIGDYDFDGPFSSTDSIENKSGLYAILHYKEGKYYLLDIGESSRIKKEIEDRDRKEWEKSSNGVIEYSVIYTPKLWKDDRKEIETKIVDLSADFRLKDTKVYEDTYKVKHTAKDLIHEAVYGLPELHRGGIEKARIVANPGCLATGLTMAHLNN